MADLQKQINDAALTVGLEADAAANDLANLTGSNRLELLGALNVAAGNARANWVGMAAVCRQLGFTAEGL